MWRSQSTTSMHMSGGNQGGVQKRQAYGRQSIAGICRHCRHGKRLGAAEMGVLAAQTRPIAVLVSTPRTPPAPRRRRKCAWK